MRRVDLQIVRTGDNGFRLILGLFETQSVGTGMARTIPGGAEIILGGSPTDMLGKTDCPVMLKMNLPDESNAAVKSISDWFRGKLEKVTGVSVMVQGRECRFEEGELKRLLEIIKD
jgi:hypothetical protein